MQQVQEKLSIGVMLSRDHKPRGCFLSNMAELDPCLAWVRREQRAAAKCARLGVYYYFTQIISYFLRTASRPRPISNSLVLHLLLLSKKNNNAKYPTFLQKRSYEVESVLSP
jgi:hypothetical protein